MTDFPLTQAVLGCEGDMLFRVTLKMELALFLGEAHDAILPRPMEFHPTGYRTPSWRRR